MKPPMMMYVVTHDGMRPLVATPFAASPLAALDAASIGLMILARDPAAALTTAAHALSAGVVATPRAGSAIYRDGYAAALRDLAAFVKTEIEAVATPGPHPTSEAIRGGRHDVLERVSSWIASHAPTDPLPYPDKDG